MELRRSLPSLVLVLAAALVPYSRLPPWPLYPDAERAVTKNAVVSGGSPADVVTSDFWGKKRGDPAATGSYRPAVSLTYWVQHRLTGARPAPYHLLDMLLHATAAVLLLAFLRPMAPGLAVLGAMLFAVHPAVSEAVCSVVGRADLLAGASLAAALLLHRRALHAVRPLPWEAASLAALAVALLAKEYAVVFPVLVLAATGLHDRATDRRRIGRFAILALLLVAAYLALRAAVLGSVGEVQMVVEADTPLAGRPFLDRLANAFWTLLPAARLLFVPTGLDHVYGVGTLAIASGFSDPKALAGIVLAGGAAALAAVRWRRSGDATPLVALHFFVLPLLPALNTVGVTVLLFAERFLYVPAMGFALCVVWGLERVERRWRARRPVRVALAVVAVVFAVLTARRVEDWRSNETLAQAALRAHPRSAMALHETGMMLAQRGEYAEAARLVRRSLDVQATRPFVWRNYALVLDRLGRPAEAVDAWSRAVQLTPAGVAPSRTWVQGLTAAWEAAGRSEAALAALARAHDASPGDARVRRDLVQSLLAGAEFHRAAGRHAEAVGLATRVLDVGDLSAAETAAVTRILGGPP